jgi:hypothetical protein
MRILLAMLLTAHALAHIPEFLVSWRLIADRPDLPYRSTVLGGRVRIGATSRRVLGLLWLLVGFTVGLAAVQLFRNTDDWWGATLVAAATSSVMTAIGWPDSKTGVVINVVVIVFLVWAARSSP